MFVLLYLGNCFAMGSRRQAGSRFTSQSEEGRSATLAERQAAPAAGKARERERKGRDAWLGV